MSRSILAVALAVFALLCGPAMAQDAQNAPTNTTHPDFSWVDILPRQSGVVLLPEAGARLNLGDNYDFLSAADAKRVIVEVWRNPPGSADGVLGMILPKGGDPRADATWGAIVTFLDTGYVPDTDAAKTDYAKLLDQMRQSVETENAEREKVGVPVLHLVGWAQPPNYDPRTHVLIWARDLQNGGGGEHTLNYDIRVLGRRGVLSLNVLAPVSSLPAINAAASSIRAAAQFDTGARYADYQQGSDKTASFGVAGLIAAGAGALAVKELGLLGLLLVFGKKAGLLFVAGFAALAAWFRRTYSRIFKRKAIDVGVPPSPPPGGDDLVR